MALRQGTLPSDVRLKSARDPEQTVRGGGRFEMRLDDEAFRSFSLRLSPPGLGEFAMWRRLACGVLSALVL